MADENPYRSPDDSSPRAVETLDRNEKRDGGGCLALVLLAPLLLDTFGVLMCHAGAYCRVVFVVGLGGFAGGAALGGYVSVKIMRRPWWSSCRWVIFGLVGMCLSAAIAFTTVLRWR